MLCAMKAELMVLVWV